MVEETPLDAAPPKEGSRFRGAVGMLALVGGLLALAGLYIAEIPTGNRDALMLALGLVLGWGGQVVGYEFGSSVTGRKAAEAGLKAEREP